MPLHTHLDSLSRGRTSTRLDCVVLALAWLVLVTATPAQMDQYSIKAAYLYNFSKYVEWPAIAHAASDSTFFICIVGEDPFGNRLDQAVAGKTSGDGRMLAVRRLNTIEPTSLRQCEMIFLSESEKSNATAIKDAVKAFPIFTVADFGPFAEEGGIADLRLEGTKVRIDLNVSAATQANLRISGKLQQVAHLIK